MPDLEQLYGFEQKGAGAAGDLAKMASSFSGINTAGDVRSRYGITGVQDIFSPFYKMLASNRAQGLRGANLRAGRSASPGMSFSGIEAGSENALQGLMGQEAQAKSGQENLVAQLLQNAFQSKDQFGLNKSTALSQMYNSLFGNRLGLEQFKYQSEGPNLVDLLGTILGAASGPAAMALSPSPTFNFGGKP